MYHDVLNVQRASLLPKEQQGALRVRKECIKINLGKDRASHAQKEPIQVKWALSQEVNAYRFAAMEHTALQGWFHVWNARETLTAVYLLLMDSRSVQVALMVNLLSNLEHSMLDNADKGASLERTQTRD